MHGSLPVPPDPESERRGHELRDVAIKPVLYFLIGLLLFGGILQGAMSLIMRGFVAQDTKIAVPSGKPEDARREQADFLSKSLRDKDNKGREASLQRDTTQDMLDMYAEEDKVLNTYKVDSKSGKIRVPIQRALQIVAKKGLPHRDTPSALIDNDLPYPVRSEPYMSKR